MDEAKPFKVGKRLVYEGWKEVKSNKGSAGIDGIGVEEYERKLHNNLYKLWNRMSSGSYFPKPVKLVEIPKSNGGKRPLGIPRGQGGAGGSGEGDNAQAGQNLSRGLIRLPPEQVRTRCRSQGRRAVHALQLGAGHGYQQVL